jgi:hypothetical protein
VRNLPTFRDGYRRRAASSRSMAPPNEPFGAMAVFADGHRTAMPADFRGPPIDVLAEMAERAKHPVLRARLADTCWMLDRKRGRLAAIAAAAYFDIVKKVDGGALKFRVNRFRCGHARAREA